MAMDVTIFKYMICTFLLLLFFTIQFYSVDLKKFISLDNIIIIIILFNLCS